MFTLTFTPNPRWAAWAAQAHVNNALAYLRDQQDKTFSLVVGGQTYALYYELRPDGQATIYSSTGGSVVIPELQLNIGSWLLPAAESLALPDQRGLNPGASQGLCREIYEGALPPEVGQALLEKIREIGLFQIIRQKNRQR